MYIFYVLQARAQTAVFVFCLFFILQELHVFLGVNQRFIILFVVINLPKWDDIIDLLASCCITFMH